MFRESVQSRINWLIGISVFLITVVVTPLTTLDPINVPKLWVLVALGGGISGTLLAQPKVLLIKSNLIYIAAAKSLFLFMLIALLASNTSFSQQFFGVNGRNTGLLTYFSFGTLFIASAIATNKLAVKPFLYSICAVLGINALYGLVQALGKDPFKWSNPYTPVIGTLGNPNFAAAFLGMGTAVAITYLVAPKIDIKFRSLSASYIAVALFDILKSDAQQGIIVFLLSGGLIGYFLIKYKFKKLYLHLTYAALGLIATLLGILGTLQKGPLVPILYKPSVTYRGDYWRAGLDMFKSHPWFGVGLDAYGDYYRSARTLAATLRRGPATVSNAAHNVFIDIAATAGIFALIAYLVVIFLGFRAALQISKRCVEFDPFFIAIFVMWIGYLVQSAISINNIALGIWGWVLPGMLIAIDRWHTEDSIKRDKVKSTSDFSSMTMVVGIVIGGVIGYLPFNSDANFRHALETGNPENIYKAATRWPSDVSRLNYAIQVFDQNKVPDKSIELARRALELNPRSFDDLIYIYSSPSTTGNEKREILDELKALDPHNPDLAKLG